MKTTPKGVIMILHEAYTSIDINLCIQALPESWQKLHKPDVRIGYAVQIKLGETFDLDFSQLALEHQRQFRDKVIPLLEQYSEYVIAYFGFVPIPLGIDFGYQFHNFRNLEIFQYHHISKEWYQDVKEKKHIDNELQPNQILDKEQGGIENALLRLSISHSVNQSETSQVVENAAEIDLSFAAPNEDVIESKDRMVEIGERVKTIFDQIADNKSGIKIIHFFASIPCGLAFLVGSKISPNIHPYLQTYEYNRNVRPVYKKAILVKSKLIITKELSEEDKEKAEELRESSHFHLIGDIHDFCKKNQLKKGQIERWPLDLVPLDKKDGIMNESFWSQLPHISETSLISDEFAKVPETIQNGFFYDSSKWHIDDYFFINLNKRVEKERQQCVLRLFLFYEVLHLTTHKLGGEREIDLENSPKVMEIADYQSDVYALLTEYGFGSTLNAELQDARPFFLNAINMLIESMWCFDDLGVELSEIQIRRLNRYLIWFWQFIRIEKYGNNVTEVVKILEEKPILEITGLRTKEENNRLYYELEKRENIPLGLTVFYKNEVIKESTSDLEIELLLEGFKEMKSDKIQSVIKSFFPEQ